MLRSGRCSCPHATFHARARALVRVLGAVPHIAIVTYAPWLCVCSYRESKMMSVFVNLFAAMAYVSAAHPPLTA